MALTRGHLLRHFQGKKGGFHPAMLDVAQDYLLFHLHSQGLFDLGLVFKGGTSLRKMRSGSAGRFSTDLDFCASNSGLTSLVLDVIDNSHIGPFSYHLANRDDDTGRADLRIIAPFGPKATENMPTPIDILSKVELSPRSPWLTPQTLPFLSLPVHECYELKNGELLPALPVVRAEEAIAEKLARYARVPLARDLYDLVWYGRQGALDESLIRKLWIFKIYYDVVIDNRWSSMRFTPQTILAPRSARQIDEESIGYLIQPVDIPGWEKEFRVRYAFLSELTKEEQYWSSCHAGKQYEFHQAVKALAT